ncbi:unnamed protein product [Nyctereutes procyonoides]|uniref:(raccoon dog) hypothetical protein n=1 Tax=Nyctereutes procyonoides TaxID=34880 RepID=A0A811Y4E3_NYCPR|nr:unnamed protein product [Nyctereutes procyonoides]
MIQKQNSKKKKKPSEALNRARDKLVVVDFSVTWGGPCKMSKPFFHTLSEKSSSVVFLEVDMDNSQDAASECEVKCMPTFHLGYTQFSGVEEEAIFKLY